MKNYLINAPFLLILTALFSCYGAEMPKPSASSSLKSSLKKQPSVRGGIKFYEGPTAYRDLHSENSTPQQRHNNRIAAQAKRQSFLRQQQAHSSRTLAKVQANSEWQTDGEHKPRPYDPSVVLADDYERAAKLQALTDVLEIERENASPLTPQEQLEKESAFAAARTTAAFMKMASMDLRKLEQTIPDLIQSYPREIILLVDFIVDTLIEEKIISDITIAQRDFTTKVDAIDQLGSFHPQAFQEFIQEYLEKYEYSFPSPALPVLPTMTLPATTPSLPAAAQAGPSQLIEFDLDDF
jgi:hypothetical protein